MSSDFFMGVLTGWLIAGIVAFISTFYRGWIKRSRATDKPQMIPQFTKNTPTEVYTDSMRARLTIYVFWIIFGVIAILLWAWLDPRVWDTILQMFEQFF